MLHSVTPDVDAKSFAPNYVGRWKFFGCRSCSGVVTVRMEHETNIVQKLFPEARTVAADLPERARAYLAQAIESLSAPSGAVMLAASAVDAMLKHLGYKKGSLYTRIDEAQKAGHITAEMAAWAHDVRLDANDQRHDDEAQPMPGQEDARRAVDFVDALGEFLFVLPARVKRGRAAVKPPTES